MSSGLNSSAPLVVVATAGPAEDPVVTVTEPPGADRDATRVQLFIAGTLCQNSCDVIRADLTARAETADHLSIDLSNVTQLGAAGFALLLDLHRALAERGRFMVLDNPSPEARKVLDILSWDEVSRAVRMRATAAWPGPNRSAPTAHDGG